MARTRRWVERAVVGLNLCPFAAPVLRAGRVRWAVSAARDADGAIRDALAEAERLLTTPAEDLSTSLLILPDALADFEAFLDAVTEVEGALEAAGAEGVLQVATFHPDYAFEGAPPDDAANHTNRAPWPILHLLREDEVAEAIARHPDPEGIPDRNVARLRALSAAALADLSS